MYVCKKETLDTFCTIKCWKLWAPHHLFYELLNLINHCHFSVRNLSLDERCIKWKYIVLWFIWYKTGKKQAEESRNKVVFSIIFPTMSSQELIVKSEVDLKQQRESLNYVMHFLVELIKLRAICNHTFPFSRWKISGVDEVRALVRRYVCK